MDQLSVWIGYVEAHARAAVLAALALVALYYLANYKPKATRDAEKRLGQLREKQGDQYNKLRPLR